MQSNIQSSNNWGQKIKKDYKGKLHSVNKNTLSGYHVLFICSLTSPMENNTPSEMKFTKDKSERKIALKCQYSKLQSPRQSSVYVQAY